jgi:hypothetical protein
MAVPNAAQAAAKLPQYHHPDPTFWGPVINTEDDEGNFHPVLKTVKGKLAALNAAGRKAVLNFRLSWVGDRANAAANALVAAGFSRDLPTRFGRTLVSNSDWPLNGAVGKRVKDLGSRLNLQQNAGVRPGDPELTDTANAFALLSGSVAGISIDQAAADATGRLAAQLLLEMRCLADVYARWEIAANLTEQLVGFQITTPPLTSEEMLARILTFWRMEGDMSVVPENDTLDASDTPAGIDQVYLPPGRFRFSYNVRVDQSPLNAPHMFFVTWLVRASEDNFSDPSTAVQSADSAFIVALPGFFLNYGAGGSHETSAAIGLVRVRSRRDHTSGA